MTLRRQARRFLDRLAAASGLLARAEAGMRGSLTILTYHRILPVAEAARYPFPSLAMPEDAFAAQVEWLAGNATVLPAGEALAALADGRTHARPLVALTFDDGYEDSHRAAAPILEARGVRGTFFATTGPIERRELLWFDRAALFWTSGDPSRLARELEAASPGAARARLDGIPAWIDALRGVEERRRSGVLDRLESVAGPIPDAASGRFRLMRPEDVVDLARRGHEVGSHTLGHPFLTDLVPARLAEEVAGSRAVLAGWLGREVEGFCYPAGDHDERVVATVREAGYRWACTTGEGRNRKGGDPWRLVRMDVTGHRVTADGFAHDPIGFRMEVSGLRHATRRALGRGP